MTRPASELLDGFLNELAEKGIPLPVPRRIEFLRAVALTPLRTIRDLYWVARVTLVSDVAQIETFDQLFDAWFRQGIVPEVVEAEMPPDESGEWVRPAAGHDAISSPVELGDASGREASRDELLNRRLLRAARPDERFMWQRTRDAATTAIPRTTGRRRKRHRRMGEIDPRRILAHAMRNGGDIVDLRYRRRPRRMRRVLILIDVSGSAKAHSPDFIRFAHAVAHGAERVEAFTFGTRLTRITPELKHPDVDAALASLTEVILDFDGGTRIGESFGRLLANSRFVAWARGAVIVVLSDGLERGDPAFMAETTERLARLGHRLIWLTPLMGDPAYRPETRGMKAILGHLDWLGDASSPMAMLAELQRLPEVEGHPRQRVEAHWHDRWRSA